MDSSSVLRAAVKRRDVLRMGLAGSALGIGGALALGRQTARADENVRAADQRCQQIEPTAGSWKTWVLSSSGEFRPGPPPSMADTRRELQTVSSMVASVTAASVDRIRFWDAGVVYRWMDLITARIGKGTPTSDSAGRPVTGLGTSRPHSLVVVAMYDAVIAAWDAKYTYNRLRPSELDPQLQTVIPNPRSPSYPSEHAAVAWAAATVMTYLYPSEQAAWEALADEDGNLRVMAGVEYPSDAAAGKTLGKAVGQAMINRRALTDGFPGTFNVPVPTVDPTGLYGASEPLWNATNPIFPSAGTWKTWVISAPQTFRPAPYPSVSSAAGQVDQFGDSTAGTKGVLNWDRTLDQTHGANLSHNFEALLAQNPPGSVQGEVADLQRRILEERLEDNPPRTARVHALSAIAKHDANVACFAAKYFYWRIRPYQLAARLGITPSAFYTLFPTPNHPSYPAAHGAGSGAAYAIASYLFPREADAFTQEANDIAESRLWAGIHYQTDINAGLAQGRAIAAEVIRVANADGSNSVGALAANPAACRSDR